MRTIKALVALYTSSRFNTQTLKSSTTSCYIYAWSIGIGDERDKH